jgi:hypothetical protein
MPEEDGRRTVRQTGGPIGPPTSIDVTDDPPTPMSEGIVSRERSEAASPRFRRRLRRLGIVSGLLAVPALYLAATGRGDLLVGLLLWSLAGLVIAAGVLATGRHGEDVGKFLGGGDPYEGHGPGDLRHR